MNAKIYKLANEHWQGIEFQLSSMRRAAQIWNMSTNTNNNSLFRSGFSWTKNHNIKGKVAYVNISVPESV